MIYTATLCLSVDAENESDAMDEFLNMIAATQYDYDSITIEKENDTIDIPNN